MEQVDAETVLARGNDRRQPHEPFGNERRKPGQGQPAQHRFRHAGRPSAGPARQPNRHGRRRQEYGIPDNAAKSPVVPVEDEPQEKIQRVMGQIPQLERSRQLGRHERRASQQGRNPQHGRQPGLAEEPSAGRAQQEHLEQHREIPQMPRIFAQQDVPGTIGRIGCIGETEKDHDRRHVRQSEKQIGHEKPQDFVLHEPPRVPVLPQVIDAQAVDHAGYGHEERHVERINQLRQEGQSRRGVQGRHDSRPRVHAGRMREHDQNGRCKLHGIVMARFAFHASVPSMRLS